MCGGDRDTYVHLPHTGCFGPVHQHASVRVDISPVTLWCTVFQKLNANGNKMANNFKFLIAMSFFTGMCTV